MKQKSIFFALTLILCLSLAPMSVQAANVPEVVYTSPNYAGEVIQLGDGYTATAIEFVMSRLAYKYHIMDSAGDVMFADLDIAYVGYYGGLFFIMDGVFGRAVYKADGEKLFPHYSTSAFNNYTEIDASESETVLPEYFIVTTGDLKTGVVDRNGKVIVPLQSEYNIITSYAGGYFFGYSSEYGEAVSSFDGSVTVVRVGGTLVLGKDGAAVGFRYYDWHLDEEFFVELPPLDTSPTQPPQPQTVSPTPSTVFVNGDAKAFEAYLIDGNNFFKLRDLAYVLNGTNKQFSVGYDDATMAITLTSGQAYEPDGGEMAQGDGMAKTATHNAAINISKDGVPVEITAYMIDGNNFMRLRDIMRLLDVEVGYDDETRNITIDTSQPY